jgi:mRNA-degrading endonuclease toxin of MazEF toxin-antitoxin module
LSPDDLRAAGLPKPSIVKCGKLLTIDQRLIRKGLGRLPDRTLQAIKQHLLTVLA